MPFKRFVEVGRIALVNFGAEEGKLCTIVEVIDGKRVLVDGPAAITGVARQVLDIKCLALTDFVIDIPRGARHATVSKYFKKAEIEKKWAETSWAKKRAARMKKLTSTDFDRFKTMVEHKKEIASKNQKKK